MTTLKTTAKVVTLAIDQDQADLAFILLRVEVNSNSTEMQYFKEQFGDDIDIVVQQ